MRCLANSMYRIYIDSDVEKHAIAFAKEVLKAKPYVSNLVHFKNHLACKSDKKFETSAKKYVQLIIDSYWHKNPKAKLSCSNSILSAKSSSFYSYIQQFEQIIPPKKLKTKIQYKNSKGTTYDGEFWSVLIRVMDYGHFKSTYYECIEEMGIEACVYCNMSPADKCDSNFANYQMEHFYPKNKFPFLSTSFFNFFPCCALCNQKKGKEFDKDGFDLYREKISDCANPFKFTTRNAVCYYTKLKQYKNKFEKEKGIKVVFAACTNHGRNQIKKLKIEERYNCNRVRRKIYELLFDYERYTKTQIRVTSQTFQKLPSLSVNSVYDVFRDYSKEEDIHKEQLTKFSIDFGKETGML